MRFSGEVFEEGFMVRFLVRFLKQGCCEVFEEGGCGGFWVEVFGEVFQ